VQFLTGHQFPIQNYHSKITDFSDIDSNYLACGVNCTSLEIRSSGGKLMPDNVSLTTNFTEDDSLNDYLGLAKMEENGPPQLRVHSLFRASEVNFNSLL
jgi:hypothetical protein